MTALTEIRKLSNTEATIREVTNKEHLIRPFCTNHSKIDEYGTLQIEIAPQYNRPPWTTIDHQQHDFELCEDPTINVSVQKQAGSKKKEEVGYAIVWKKVEKRRAEGDDHGLGENNDGCVG
jgi:hypothetical protein